jgi:trehalose-6-phosphatase
MLLMHVLLCWSLQPGLGLAAEHGFFIRPPGHSRWHSRFPLTDNSWQGMVLPILKQVGA